MTEKELKYVLKGSRVCIKTELGEFEGTVTSYDVDIGIISVKNVICVTTGKSLPKMMNFMKNEIVKLSTVSLPKKKTNAVQNHEIKVAKTSSGPDGAPKPPDTVSKISGLASSSSLENTDEMFAKVQASGKNRTARVLDMRDFIPSEQMLLGGISSRQAEVLSRGFTGGRPPSSCVVLDGFCEDFSAAVDTIKSTSAIGLAMVGENLGRNGQLGWVAISGKHCLFLFDVPAFGEKNLMGHLRAVFENENIVKVVHDCRMISCILLRRHEIKFVNVFDTQVASVLVFRRTHGILPPGVDPLLTCLFEHLSIPQETIYLQKELAQKFKEQPEVWLQRPAPENVLQSVAFSVRYLNELRLRLMEEMLRDFIDGVDVYLGLYRDAEDNDLDKLQNVTHVLPAEFRNLEANAELSRQKRDELYSRDMSLGGAFRFAPTVDKFIADHQPAKDFTKVTENALSERAADMSAPRLAPLNPDKQRSPSAEPVSMYDILKQHRPALPKSDGMVFLAAGSEPTLAVANERPKTLKSKLLPSSDTESNWRRKGSSLMSSNPRQVDVFEDFSAIPSPERLCIGQCTMDPYARSYDNAAPLGKGTNLEIPGRFESGAPSEKLRKSESGDLFNDNAENNDSSDSVSISVDGSVPSVDSGGLAETLGTDTTPGFVQGTKIPSDFSGDDERKENSRNPVSARESFREPSILVNDGKPLKGQVTDGSSNVQSSSFCRAKGVLSLGRGVALMKLKQLTEDPQPGKSFVKSHA